MRGTGNNRGLGLGMLLVPALLISCAHADQRLAPEVLQERMLRPDRSVSLCGLNLLNAAGSGTSAMLGLAGAIYDANKAQSDAPYAKQLASEFNGIYEGALMGSGAFRYVPGAKLLPAPEAKPVPMQTVAHANGLHACVAAKSSLLVLVGWNKKVSVSTEWELTGPSGWKMTIETEAISKETHGMGPDTADPKLRPVFLQLASESAAMFLASLAERGMLPASTSASAVPPRAPAPSMTPTQPQTP